MRILPIACRFAALTQRPPCGAPAVAYVALSEGCVDFPRERRMYVCGQHLTCADPLGDIEVIDAL